MDLLTEIWPYLAEHQYLFLFLGMLIGGETFLLPAVYLAARGIIPFYIVFILSASATLVSDTVWYGIGRFFNLEKILAWEMFEKKHTTAQKMHGIFKDHGLKILFLSKFVYGTRTLVQILAGSLGMPFPTYSVVNLAGILSYLAVISATAFFTREGLDSLSHLSYNEYIYAIVFIVVIGIIHICLKKWLGKKITASSSQPGMKKEQ